MHHFEYERQYLLSLIERMMVADRCHRPPSFVGIEEFYAVLRGEPRPVTELTKNWAPKDATVETTTSALEHTWHRGTAQTREQFIASTLREVKELGASALRFAGWLATDGSTTETLDRMPADPWHQATMPTEKPHEKWLMLRWYHTDTETPVLPGSGSPIQRPRMTIARGRCAHLPPISPAGRCHCSNARGADRPRRKYARSPTALGGG
jgi:hypothetical protein